MGRATLWIGLWGLLADCGWAGGAANPGEQPDHSDVVGERSFTTVGLLGDRLTIDYSKRGPDDAPFIVIGTIELRTGRHTDQDDAWAQLVSEYEDGIYDVEMVPCRRVLLFYGGLWSCASYQRSLPFTPQLLRVSVVLDDELLQGPEGYWFDWSADEQMKL
jgi:hypothetical protein